MHQFQVRIVFQDRQIVGSLQIESYKNSYKNIIRH